MRVLVTGCTGQVGWELARSLMPLGNVLAVDYPQCDFTKQETIKALVREFKPEVIVNPAAYTAVDKAESEQSLAMQINGDAPGILAEEAKRLGALLVHYSTDYVFDGTKAEPYVESDNPNPLGVYGRSKLAGERAIQAASVDNLIFRTSWVFASRAQNFVKTILRLASEREELKIIADQIGSPTWARNIADATAHAIRQAQQERASGEFVSGIYNMTSSGATSWHGFTQAIVAEARKTPLGEKLRVQRILPIPTEAYPLPAPRPKNSRLDGLNFARRFGLQMPQWDVALARCIIEMAGQ